MSDVRRKTGLLWSSGTGDTSHLRSSAPTPTDPPAQLPGRGNRFPAEIVVHGSVAFLLTTGLESNPFTLTNQGRCAIDPRPESESLHLRADLPNSCTATGMRDRKIRSRDSLMAQRLSFSSSDGKEGVKKNQNNEGTGPPLPLLDSQSGPAEK